MSIMLYTDKITEPKTTQKELIENSDSFKESIVYRTKFTSGSSTCARFVEYERNIKSNSFKKKYSQSFKSQDSIRLALRQKWKEHIREVEFLRNLQLDELFNESMLNTVNLKKLISILNANFSKELFLNFEKILEGFIDEDIPLEIDYNSFLNYLYILPSKKIQMSDIVIDNETGKIIIFYNANKKDFYSKKVTIMVNEKDFTVSIISRKDGLAKFSGLYASMFPEAYYKIDNILETLI